METADATYADPSALLTLYIHQPQSTAMNRWISQVKRPLLITHHGRVEIGNGIALAAFRRYITVEAMADAYASFDENFDQGRYIQADLLWRDRDKHSHASEGRCNDQCDARSDKGE